MLKKLEGLETEGGEFLFLELLMRVPRRVSPGVEKQRRVFIRFMIQRPNPDTEVEPQHKTRVTKGAELRVPHLI